MSLSNHIAHEVAFANEKYGRFRSTHEGLGVLIEEVVELITAIRSNELWSVYHEAVQIAAVAMRLAEAISESENESDGFWKRSTGK